MNYFPTLNQLWGDYPLTFSQMISTDIAFAFFIYAILIMFVIVLAVFLNRWDWLRS